MDTDKILEFLKKPKAIIGCIAGFMVLIFVISLITTYTGNRNEGYRQEHGMTQHWNSMQTRYGQWRIGLYDKLGIAREKRDAIDSIIAHAVSGRYDKANTDPDHPQIDGQAVFSAIKEAYPDLKGLDIYDKLITAIQAGREAFGKDQEQMQDMVRSYNDWRTTGSFLHPAIVDWLGFPSHELVATVGDKKYYGTEALDKMSKVIVGADTIEIFDTGVDKSLTGK